MRLLRGGKRRGTPGEKDAYKTSISRRCFSFAPRPLSYPSIPTLILLLLFSHPSIGACILFLKNLKYAMRDRSDQY